MSGDGKKVVLVTLEQPCTACVITCGLAKEIIEKVRTRYGGFDFDVVKIAHIKQLKEVEGLEVEKLPAVLIEGEQITAGSLPSPDLLRYYIYEGD